MLGRTDAVQIVLPPPSAEEVDAAELAGGRRILELASNYHQSTVPAESPTILSFTDQPIRTDPYKYLIDLRIECTEYDGVHAHLREDHKKIFERLPESAKTYLRILGRTDAVQNLTPRPSPQRIADAELAGGWRILRLSSDRSNLKWRRGFFFDPERITPEAIRRCPQMPYMFGIREEDLDDQWVEHGTTLEWTENMADQVLMVDLSYYTRMGRTLMISNAIIALIDHSHILWPELITSLYGTAHPLYIIDRCIDINVDDNEKLVLAARDEGIPSGFFRYPNRNLGSDVEADEAYHLYNRQRCGYDTDEDDEEVGHP